MSGLKRHVNRAQRPGNVPYAGESPMLDPQRLSHEREALAQLAQQQRANENLIVAQLATQVVCSQYAGAAERESAGALLRRVFDWGFDAAHGVKEAES